MKNDWIPGREVDYVDMCEDWVVIIDDEGTIIACNWNANMCLDTSNAVKTFLHARTAFKDVGTKENSLAKAKARKAAEKAMRLFANSFVRYNDSVPDNIRMKLGIRQPDTTPTAQPKPMEQPETIVENTIYHYRHSVKAINIATGKAAKPEGVHGVRFAWTIGGEKPATGEDLVRYQFSRKAVITIIHTESEKGKPAYYATCYENRRGEKGPWSPVAEAYIA